MVRTKSTKVPTEWPTRRAAAAELSVIMKQPTLTVETVTGWLSDPSCPLPPGRGPIPKVPLLIWIISEKRGVGRPADASSTAIKSAQAAIFQAKADAIAGRMVRVEDVVSSVEAAVDELKQDNIETIPDAVFEMMGKRTPEEIRDEHRVLAAAALNRFSAAARTVKRA